MKNRLIINILVSFCKGNMFLDAVDTFKLVGQPMIAKYICRNPTLREV
jgi:uncharacterized membrane protein